MSIEARAILITTPLGNISRCPKQGSCGLEWTHKSPSPKRPQTRNFCRLGIGKFQTICNGSSRTQRSNAAFRNPRIIGTLVDIWHISGCNQSVFIGCGLHSNPRVTNSAIQYPRTSAIHILQVSLKKVCIRVKMRRYNIRTELRAAAMRRLYVIWLAVSSCVSKITSVFCPLDVVLTG